MNSNRTVKACPACKSNCIYKRKMQDSKYRCWKCGTVFETPFMKTVKDRRNSLKIPPGLLAKVLHQ